MEKWIVQAFISMCFAGFTSVIAKKGLTGISGELGLTVRTVFVFGFVLLFALLSSASKEVPMLTTRNVFWLGISGLTTAMSWIFYYRALKAGDVATVALIDKGSVLVSILLAWLLLKENITLQTLSGAGLIVAGLLVIARK